MKKSQIFGGTLFLLLGLLLLLDNFFPILITKDLWLKIAPLILVFIGFSILIKHNLWKNILLIISALILSLVIFSIIKYSGKLFQSNINIFSKSENNQIFDSTFSYKYSDNIQSAILNLESAAGSYKIYSRTEDLIKIKTSSSIDLNYFNVEHSNSVATINFGTKEKSFNIADNFFNRVNIYLNKLPVWHLKIKSGAAKLNLDLSDFRIEKVDFDIGATKLKLKLGDKFHHSEILINSGASSITIEIPKDSGCEINSDVVLSSKNFDNFIEVNSNKFKTGNFEIAKNKISLKLTGGASSIDVERY